MSSERAEQRSIPRINLGEGDENADWIEMRAAQAFARRRAADPCRARARCREVARRTLQLDLIDQIEGTELLIEHYRLDDEARTRLRRRLHALNRQMIAISDPDEVRFFSLRPVPPETARR